MTCVLFIVERRKLVQSKVADKVELSNSYRALQTKTRNPGRTI